MVAVTHFSDPGCPWAYSASPAHAVLRWRYGDQLQWRLVTIGLTEQAEQYVRRGYTPAGSARGYLSFRRRGMPFATEPRPRVAATGRACRAIVATRLFAPEHELAVFRALQFGWFTTPLVLDEREDLAAALARVDGLDAAAVLDRLDDPEVEAAYQADRAEARTAEGSPTEAQGRAAQTDGAVRYTAPSLVFECDGRRLEAGGFQPLEAYDVLLANLDPALHRRPPAEDPLEVLEALGYGLVTQEVAATMTPNNEAPDREAASATMTPNNEAPDRVAAEAAIIDLAASGRVIRRPLGDDALWEPAQPRVNGSGPGRTARGRAPAARR
jgi:protein-disulfide isomerase-like protein with CxxC motif